LTGLLSTTTSSFPPATIPLFALDTWYKVTKQVSGSSSVVLTASINDVPLMTFTDQGYRGRRRCLAAGDRRPSGDPAGHHRKLRRSARQFALTDSLRGTRRATKNAIVLRAEEHDTCKSGSQ